MEGQGDIRFPITTSNPRAREFFNQGLAQMHAFSLVEAERSFLQAASLDSAAPMPQWGIAMVAAGDYRPGYELKPLPARPPGERLRGGAFRAAIAARRAVSLGSRPGVTELEKMYIAAVAALRDTSAADAEDEYVRALHRLLAAHPAEVEARLYLALRIMRGFDSSGEPLTHGSVEAVELLQQAIRESPNHPGAHHYLIHAVMGSADVRRASESCRIYPSLVPAIPHAYSDCGDLWLESGQLDEADRSFAAASEGELRLMRKSQTYPAVPYARDLRMRALIACHRGDFEAAVGYAATLMAMPETPLEAELIDEYQTPYRQGWFAMMWTLVHFRRWQAILDGTTLPVYDKPREQAWGHWARAMAFRAGGNKAASAGEVQQMDRALANLARQRQGQAPPELAAARQQVAGKLLPIPLAGADFVLNRVSR
jgi:tetratricopeptide (TPR) repeat protein